MVDLLDKTKEVTGANKSHTQDVVSAVKAALDPEGDVIMSKKRGASTAVTSQDQVTPKRSIQINEEHNVTTTYIKLRRAPSEI